MWVGEWEAASSGPYLRSIPLKVFALAHKWRDVQRAEAEEAERDDVRAKFREVLPRLLINRRSSRMGARVAPFHEDGEESTVYILEDVPDRRPASQRQSNAGDARVSVPETVEPNDQRSSAHRGAGGFFEKHAKLKKPDNRKRMLALSPFAVGTPDAGTFDDSGRLVGVVGGSDGRSHPEV